MSGPFDTIVAPITGTGRSAVCVVRLSGPEAWTIAERVFGRRARPLRLSYGRFAHGDDGYAVLFPANRSFTGELAAELHVHGSPASVRALTALCREAGARDAEPGEFTQRAFLNGRIDLTQAEAVRDTVDAVTEAQLRASNYARAGLLAERVRQVRTHVEQGLARVEAHVDFSEEIGPLDREMLGREIGGQLEEVRTLARTAGAGRVIREGYRVAILGRPNAGKSSLLNALLGTDRAIVTDIPGTTRDTLEEALDLDGLLVRLVDTAGLRDATDPVESLGVARARAAIAHADLLLYLVDGQTGLTPEDESELEALPRKHLVVYTKRDLVPRSGLSVSMVTLEGLAELKATIRGQIEAMLGSDPAAVNARQADLLREAEDHLEAALGALGGTTPDDLVAVTLRAAAESLGEVSGDSGGANLLEQVFRDFCIGK